MGKRELLLIVVFMIAGALVYQATAPPPAPGETSFSIGRMVEGLRRHIRGNRASAVVTTPSTHPLNPDVAELRIALRSGDITIVGEDRADIAAELRVESNGYDDAEAQQLAKETVLKFEGAGSRRLATVSFPRGGTQRARLQLRIPARLQVKLDASSGHLEVSNVAAVDLATARGETQIRKVAGRVSGTHRNGKILVADAGPVRLNTIGSDLRLEQIHGEVNLTMRSGEMNGSELAGPIDIDTTATDITLEKLDKTTGILRINAVSGSVTVKALRTEGRIDVRNSDVDVIIDRAAPLAIYSEGGASVDITPPPGGYQLDAVAANADITLPESMLTVTTSGQEHRATGAVKGGGPTITIRTGRGEITVRPR
jgi:hypothetical protein